MVIRFNSAGEGCASFYFIIYILLHLTVFHRAPQCYGSLLDRGRGGDAGEGAENTCSRLLSPGGGRNCIAYRINTHLE